MGWPVGTAPTWSGSQPEALLLCYDHIWLLSLDLHQDRPVSETGGLLLSHSAIIWSHRPKLHRDLRVTSARSC
jgi:hypothetical protein